MDDGSRRYSSFWQLRAVQLDAAHEGVPPREFLLADEHLGPRTADHRQAPSGSVWTYRLVGRDEERDGYVYRLAPRD